MAKYKMSCPNDETHDTLYASKYDLFACMKCDIWTTEVCKCALNGDCEFNSAYKKDNSPQKPSEVLKLTKFIKL